MNELLSLCANVATQVGILFVLIAVGALLAKLKVVNKTGIDQIIDILLYAVTPCLIINSFMKVEYTADTMVDLAVSAGCAVITHIIGMLLALVFMRVKDISAQSVYRFGVIFSNGGFMSLPMAQALAGEKGVALVSMYVIVFNIITWIYGVTLFKSQKHASKIKVFINPGTIGAAFGLPLLLLQIKLPLLIATPLGYIASLNTPLAMLVTGYFIVSANFKAGMRDGNMWLSAAFRLIAVPLIAILIFKYGFHLSGELALCCAIPACAPCAVSTMMLSAKFGGNTQIACLMLSVTTVLSIVTMPLLLAFASV